MKTSKRVVALFIMCMMVCSMVLMSMATTVHATNGLEDDLSEEQQSTSSSETGDLFGDLKDQDIGEAEGIGDILGGNTPMTSEQLSEASKWTAPLTNIIGYAMGVIIIITITLVGLITALDLLYIAVPPVRNFLYKAGTDGTGAYTGGMPAGGYGMGGMGGYGRRGMGMGMGAMGVGGASGGTVKPHQWVSDEAVACAALLGGSQQAVNMGVGGGMGMGMGGMNGMGAMGMQQPEQAPMRMKSVLWVYIKKRAVFLVLLMVAVMVLTSSALMGTGVNLAQWVLRIIGMINGKIA